MSRNPAEAPTLRKVSIRNFPSGELRATASAEFVAMAVYDNGSRKGGPAASWKVRRGAVPEFLAAIRDCLAEAGMPFRRDKRVRRP